MGQPRWRVTIATAADFEIGPQGKSITYRELRPGILERHGRAARPAVTTC
jgi:hypothetical protein